jgi:hypothetical protein
MHPVYDSFVIVAEELAIKALSRAKCSGTGIEHWNLQMYMM